MCAIADDSPAPRPAKRFSQLGRFPEWGLLLGPQKSLISSPAGNKNIRNRKQRIEPRLGPKNWEDQTPSDAHRHQYPLRAGGPRRP